LAFPAWRAPPRPGIGLRLNTVPTVHPGGGQKFVKGRLPNVQTILDCLN